MAVNPIEHVWTYEDYLDLPNDGRRYYLDEGRLVEMVPPGASDAHQSYQWHLGKALGRYEDAHLGIGQFRYAPFDVLWTPRRMPGTTAEPDILFVREERADIISSRAVEGSPDLVIEILSPSWGSHEKDVVRNVRLYRERGVPEYWLCDPNGPLDRKITVHRLTGWPNAPAWETGLLVDMGSVVLPGIEHFIPEAMR